MLLWIEKKSIDAAEKGLHRGVCVCRARPKFSKMCDHMTVSYEVVLTVVAIKYAVTDLAV